MTIQGIKDEMKDLDVNSEQTCSGLDAHSWRYDLPNGGYIHYAFTSGRSAMARVWIPTRKDERELSLCKSLDYSGDCHEVLGYFKALIRIYAKHGIEDCWDFVNHLYASHYQPR